jgi:hypothetical protein
MLAPKGRVERLQRRALSALCSPCSRLSRRLSGPPTSASSPFPYPYIEVAMVMILLWGSHVQQIWEGRHLDPPGGHLDKPEEPVEERHTGSFLLLLRFLRKCVWCGCRCTRLSDCGDDLQDSRHSGVALPIVGKGLAKSSVYVRLSGAKGGEPIATLALSMRVFGLIQPTNPVRGLYTEVIAQKA